MPRSLSFDIDEAIKLFKETPSWAAVAKALNVSRGSIMSALRPLGYETNRKTGNPRAWDLEEAFDLYMKGMTVKEISEKMGVPVSTLYAGLRDRK